MLDDTDLHRHDFKLLADFFANSVFAAAADARQFMFGNFEDDLDARQIGGQWLAFAAALGRSNDLFI
ncbi:hypothetical protein D3C75_1381780 [compost metagenome]